MGERNTFILHISTRLIIFLMLATAGTGLNRLGSVQAIAVTTTDEMLESTHTTLPVDVPETEADEPMSVVSEKSDLSEAETKDPKKLEIIKQIRKINNDGSYTVGYEAEDGTFKIESRDVLGNIKGTYGYIDENGDIQRVSYNAHNSTGIKGTQPAPVTEDVVHIPPKFNRSHIGAPTTRRPASYHSTSTVTPQRTSVIQTIPRKRPHPTSTTERPAMTRMTETSTSSSEATMASSQSSSVQTPKPLLIIRPTPLPLMAKTIEQLARPEKLESSDHITRIYSKSVTPRQRELERKPLRGNFLRRQLPQDSGEQYEAQQQIVYGQSAGEEIANLFSATPPGLRPIYTTTPVPRIPVAVLAARQRAAQLQNLLTSERPETTTERVYAKPPRKQQEPAPVMYEPATEPTSENSYVTDTPGSAVQIPANSNREVTETAEDERRVYRQRPIEFRPRESYRYLPAQDRPERYRVPLGVPPHARGFPAAEASFYRDPSGRGPVPINPENYPSDDEDNSIAYRQQRRPQGPPPPPHYIQNQQEAPTANSVPNAHSYPQQSYPVPYSYNPYRNPYQAPVSPYYDFPERPLTTRDFERILQLLIYRHQQVQQLQAYRFGGYTNPYYGGPSLAPPFIPGPFGAAGGGYPAQIPRPPFFNGGAGYFDPRYQNPLYSPSTGTRQYSAAAGQQQAAAEYPGPEQQGYQLQRRRQQPQPQQHQPQFAPRIDHHQDHHYQGTQPELIPPEVREDLLYRMLMLAIQQDPSTSFLVGGAAAGGGGAVGVPGVGSGFSTGLVPAGSVPRPQTTSATSPGYSKKPVRSVQILGEE
ncbi:uncharacterized protein LOC128732316 [Sabethes cyaneus]|uniref:uncharacterized protein LOC128732316 n=1 Tax=Sabethes cyaneus TaxID=53552 RepID=UPI00237E09E6|nr:uncharacterized protein LOC128732316 [Sabethes cyaneus]